MTVEVQEPVLADVVRSARGRSVVVDLDGTGLRVDARVRQALVRVAVARDLPALAEPATHALVPGMYPGAWWQFVAAHGLASRYPTVDWQEVGREWRTLAWSSVDSDVPVEGLVEFVRAVRAAGGRLVFLTGRTERFREGTESVLDRHGLGDVPLYLTNVPGDLVAGSKTRILRALAVPEELVVLDDDARNLDAVGRLPGATRIAVCQPGVTQDPVIPAIVPRVGDLVFRRRLVPRAVVGAAS